MNADSSATQNGKEVARWIATRDGIRSPTPVVPGVEKPEDWEEYRDGKLEDVAPLGSLGLAPAEGVALISWRLHRVICYETIACSQERVIENLRDRRSSSFGYGYASAGILRVPEVGLEPTRCFRTTGF